MKNNITVLLAIIVLASCSTPKYTYYFDHQNSRAGKTAAQPEKEMKVLPIDPQMLSATTSEGPVTFAETTKPVTPEKKTYAQMNKTERSALRKYLKKEVKDFVTVQKKLNSVESAKATQGMDHDLKLAVIFGAVGVAGLIIGGDVFTIIGGLALLIGVVFFVKWIIRQ